MRVFAKLRALADLQRKHLPDLQTPQDHELVREIGYHQVLGAPITLKQVMLLDLGSKATAERRLARLKRLGLVRGRRSHDDRRVVELTLHPSCMKAFARFETLLGASGGARQSVRVARHVCCLCSSEGESLDAAIRFLREGHRRDHCCVLIALPEAAARVEAALRRDGKGEAIPLLAWNGDARDAAETIGFLRGTFGRAHGEGRDVRLVGRLGCGNGRAIDFDRLLAIEHELERLVRAHGGQAMCQFDVQRVGGARLLEALRSHPDTLRHPIEIA